MCSSQTAGRTVSSKANELKHVTSSFSLLATKAELTSLSLLWLIYRRGLSTESVWERQTCRRCIHSDHQSQSSLINLPKRSRAYFGSLIKWMCFSFALFITENHNITMSCQFVSTVLQPCLLFTNAECHVRWHLSLKGEEVWRSLFKAATSHCKSPAASLYDSTQIKVYTYCQQNVYIVGIVSPLRLYIIIQYITLLEYYIVDNINK